MRCQLANEVTERHLEICVHRVVVSVDLHEEARCKQVVVWLYGHLVELSEGRELEVSGSIVYKVEFFASGPCVRCCQIMTKVVSFVICLSRSCQFVVGDCNRKRLVVHECVNRRLISLIVYRRGILWLLGASPGRLMS